MNKIKIMKKFYQNKVIILIITIKMKKQIIFKKFKIIKILKTKKKKRNKQKQIKYLKVKIVILSKIGIIQDNKIAIKKI